MSLDPAPRTWACVGSTARTTTSPSPGSSPTARDACSTRRSATDGTSTGTRRCCSSIWMRSSSPPATSMRRRRRDKPRGSRRWARPPNDLQKISVGGAHPTSLRFLMKLPDDVPGFVGRLGVAEQVEVVVVDRAFVGQELEVDDLLPVLAAEEDDRDVLHAAGLAQRERLEQFVERAEAAGKHDQGLRPQQEVQLPHGEVVELEAQFGRDVGIGLLLVRQADVQADRLCPRS